MACAIIVTCNDGADKVVMANDGADKIVTVAADYGWKRCDTDADYCRIAEADQPSTDIAFLHTGSPAFNDWLVKCYYDSCVLSGAFANCVVEPDNTPVVCADACTVTEDWSGAAAVPCKFQTYNPDAGSGGVISYGSGWIYTASRAGGGQATGALSLLPQIGTGDFSVQVKLYDWGTATASFNVNFACRCLASDSPGSFPGAGGAGAWVSYDRGGAGKWEVVAWNGTNPQDLTGASYVILRLRRVSGTMYEDCNIDGSGWTNLRSYANAMVVRQLLFDVAGGEYGKWTDWEWTA